jgi:integrase
MANRQVTPLTDTAIKNAKPKDKEYTLPDGNGLQLNIKPDGRKVWEIRYTVEGKAKKTTAGSYPETPLATQNKIDKNGKKIKIIGAREKRDELKAKVINGIDPIKEKQAQKEQKRIEDEQVKAEAVISLNTFEKVSRDFIESITGELVPRYHSLKLARLNNHIFPYIGDKPINDVTRIMIIECLEILKLSGKGETAKRTLDIINQVYRYAVTRGIVPHNITADIDKRYVIGKIEHKHMPTITDPKKIGILLNSIDEYHGELIVKSALQLATLTAQRPYNIRFAEWSEFDLEKNEWIIPADKMKMKRPHIIPITKQVKEVIEALRPHTQHKSKYLFHSLHTTLKPISDGTMNKALRRMGYANDEIVAHGFRAMFSTIANENISVHGYHTDIIERCLAHVEGNKVKGAYNHAEYTKERSGLMQWWADYLDEVKAVKQ